MELKSKKGTKTDWTATTGTIPWEHRWSELPAGPYYFTNSYNQQERIDLPQQRLHAWVGRKDATILVVWAYLAGEISANGALPAAEDLATRTVSGIKILK